jgi:hypothetical protein
MQILAVAAAAQRRTVGRRVASNHWALHQMLHQALYQMMYQASPWRLSFSSEVA